MNELAQLFTASPQAALVGASVYLILTQRRTDARVEEIATHIGLAPRKKKRNQMLGVLVASGLVMLFSACTITRKCTKAGTCTTNITAGTNTVPILREIRRMLPGY